MALQKCPVPESPGMLETPLLGCRERRDSVRPPVAINLEKNTYSFLLDQEVILLRHSLLMDQVPVFLPMEPRLAPYGRPL